MNKLNPLLINQTRLMLSMGRIQDPRFNVLKNNLSQKNRAWLNIVRKIPTAGDWLSRSGPFYDPWNRTPEILTEKLAMPQFEKFTTSFDQCCDQRAQEIIKLLDNSNRKLLILWSGGIDSTVVLTSLLKMKVPQDRLLILLSDHSIKEYPLFFQNYIQDICPWENILEFAKKGYNPQDYYVLSGAFGDNVLSGGLIPHLFNKSKGISSERLWSQYTNEICDFLWPEDPSSGQWFIQELANNISQSKIKIETIGDFFWWLHFNFRWVEVNLRRSYEIDLWLLNANKNPDTVKITLAETLEFFDHRDFQLWSMNNLGDAKTYQKMQAKQYILEWTQDQEYYQTKGKESSMPRISNIELYPDLITQDLTIHYNLDLPERFRLISAMLS